MRSGVFSVQPARGGDKLSTSAKRRARRKQTDAASRARDAADKIREKEDEERSQMSGVSSEAGDASEVGSSSIAGTASEVAGIYYDRDHGWCDVSSHYTDNSFHWDVESRFDSQGRKYHVHVHKHRGAKGSRGRRMAARAVDPEVIKRRDAHRRIEREMRGRPTHNLAPDFAAASRELVVEATEKHVDRFKEAFEFQEQRADRLQAKLDARDRIKTEKYGERANRMGSQESDDSTRAEAGASGSMDLRTLDDPTLVESSDDDDQDALDKDDRDYVDRQEAVCLPPELNAVMAAPVRLSEVTGQLVKREIEEFQPQQPIYFEVQPGLTYDGAAEFPMGAPKGWRIVKDQFSDRGFYWHKASGRVLEFHPPTDRSEPRLPYIVLLPDSDGLRPGWVTCGRFRWSRLFYQFVSPELRTKSDAEVMPGAITWVKPLLPLARGWPAITQKDAKDTDTPSYYWHKPSDRTTYSRLEASKPVDGFEMSDLEDEMGKKQPYTSEYLDTASDPGNIRAERVKTPRMAEDYPPVSPKRSRSDQPVLPTQRRVKAPPPGFGGEWGPERLAAPKMKAASPKGLPAKKSPASSSHQSQQVDKWSCTSSNKTGTTGRNWETNTNGWLGGESVTALPQRTGPDPIVWNFGTSKNLNDKTVEEAQQRYEEERRNRNGQPGSESDSVSLGHLAAGCSEPLA